MCPGNRTGDSLVHRPMLNPLSYTSWGIFTFYFFGLFFFKLTFLFIFYFFNFFYCCSSTVIFISPYHSPPPQPSPPPTPDPTRGEVGGDNGGKTGRLFRNIYKGHMYRSFILVSFVRAIVAEGGQSEIIITRVKSNVP